VKLKLKKIKIDQEISTEEIKAKAEIESAQNLSKALTVESEAEEIASKKIKRKKRI